VAYWDTEQPGRRPALLGEIQGTPTIRLYVPKKKQSSAASNAKKNVLDYNLERKAANLKRFAEENMPSFVEPIRGSSGLEKFQGKAQRNNLLQAILFTSKAKTASLTKFLSTEFRRRLLIGEVYPTKANRDVMDQFGVSDNHLPALLVILPPAAGQQRQQGGSNSTTEDDPIIVRYDGDAYTRNKLVMFLSKYALKEKVYPPAANKKDKETKKEAPKRKVKVGSDGEL
jgi:hypothetical protein